MPVPVLKISLPNYKPDKKPDYKNIGEKLDKFIKEHFYGKEIILRCISVADHDEKSIEEVINLIQKTGTDKYDPSKKSFWHNWDVYKDKGFDIFASKVKVDENFHFGEETFELFYEGAVADRGYSVKLDIIMVYDPEHMEMIPVHFSETDIEETWKFKFSEKKPEALLGIIEITD